MYKNLLRSHNTSVKLIKEYKSNESFLKALKQISISKRVISIQAQKLQLSLDNSVSFRENFAARHIGVNEHEEKAMLKALNLQVENYLLFYEII